MLLSKIPFQVIVIHNYAEKAFPMKTMINAEFKINNRYEIERLVLICFRKLSLGVVHLKAGLEVEIRSVQIEECIELQCKVCFLFYGF